MKDRSFRLQSAPWIQAKIAAIVEYYGGLPPTLQYGAKTMPPTLILHGDKDVLVPVAMAHELDEMLTKEKRPHEMKLYEGTNHGFNFPEFLFGTTPTTLKTHGVEASSSWQRI